MKRFKKALLPITTFARIDVKRAFRDKVAIFFIFIFPLIFLFVFGGLFGKDTDVNFNVALLNESENQFVSQFIEDAKEQGIIDIDEEADTLEIAKDKMNRGELDATIVLPKEFGQTGPEGYPTGQAKILYDQNNEQAGVTLASLMDTIFRDINAQIIQIDPPFTVVTESTATKGLTRFDYTFAGLLGFSMLSLGIFGPTTVFPRLKEKGVLRRYHTTTLRVWQYFTGNVISNAFVGLCSIGVMFITAVLVFDLQMRGDYLSFAAVVILGVTLLFGIGLAVGGWAKNEMQAAPLANLITFPMMFLSGVFFPTFIMPDWLQTVSGFMPLTPVIDSIRFVVTEGKTLFDLGPQLAIIGAWTVAVYIIAFRVFRWE